MRAVSVLELWTFLSRRQLTSAHGSGRASGQGAMPPGSVPLASAFGEGKGLDRHRPHGSSAPGLCCIGGPQFIEDVFGKILCLGLPGRRLVGFPLEQRIIRRARVAFSSDVPRGQSGKRRARGHCRRSLDDFGRRPARSCLKFYLRSRVLYDCKFPVSGRARTRVRVRKLPLFGGCRLQESNPRPTDYKSVLF